MKTTLQFKANILLLLLLVLSSHSALLKSQTQALSESDAKTLMNKWLPVVYFHSKETRFPTKIENFKIDWSKAELNNKEAVIDLKGYQGPSSLSQDAPVYTSILENSDGTIRISYLFLYAFNPCGPAANVYAKAVGLGIDTTVSFCNFNFGVHYGDVEHIEVYLKSDKSFNYALYAYHKWGTKTDDKLYAKDLEWENGHPVVYAARGSHASYTKSGEHKYMTFWNEKKKVAGVTVYNTYGAFIDYTSKTTRWYSTNPRLLKLNGNQVSGISNDELYLGFKYSGRLGVQYDNDKWDDFKKYTGISTIITVLKKIGYKSAANDVSDAIEDMGDELEAETVASNSFYTRSYW